ncbi:MAG: hypothetical protein L3J35_03655 [Bacteroidales bacterium]|nr:hypothetical protein [Bacteroidales bacterium]
MIPVKAIVIGGAALGLFSFFKGRQSVTDENDTTEDVIKDAENEVVKSKLSYNDSWYAIKSDLLQNELVKAWRSNDAIKRSLGVLTQLKNKNDFLYLIKKFGVRTGYGVSVAYKEPLTKWLTYFLDNSFTYKSKSGKKYKTNGLKVAKFILQKRGIDLI